MKISLSNVTKTIKEEIFFALGILPLVWQLIFVYLPILYMVVSGCLHNGTISLHNFFEVMHYPYLKIMINSFMLALSTTLICVIIGIPLAFSIVFYGGRLKYFLLLMSVTPLCINFIFHLYTWVFLLNKNGPITYLLTCLGMHTYLLHTTFSMMIVMTYNYLPFFIIPLFFSLKSFDINIIWASLDLGGGIYATTRKIIMPCLKKSLRRGLCLVYVPAFGEFVIPELMGSDKNLFVGSTISLLLSGEETLPLASTFTIVNMTFLIATLVIFDKLLRLIKL